VTDQVTPTALLLIVVFLLVLLGTWRRWP